MHVKEASGKEFKGKDADFGMNQLEKTINQLQHLLNQLLDQINQNLKNYKEKF